MTTKIIDTLLLGLVAGVGIVGSICVFSNDLGTPEHKLRIATGQVPDHQFAPLYDQSVDLGYLEVYPQSDKESVRFEIRDYNTSAEYYFSSGDGHAQWIDNDHFIHVYEVAGEYHAELTMKYHGQKKLVACKNITIF